MTFNTRAIAVLAAVASVGLASGCGGSSSGGGNACVGTQSSV